MVKYTYGYNHNTWPQSQKRWKMLVYIVIIYINMIFIKNNLMNRKFKASIILRVGFTRISKTIFMICLLSNLWVYLVGLKILHNKIIMMYALLIYDLLDVLMHTT